VHGVYVYVCGASAGQVEYASKQLLCAVHMRGGPQASCGLLVPLDEITGRYWADSAAGEPWRATG
jgi:hypothetical protein